MYFHLIDDPWLLKNKYWLFKKKIRLYAKGDSGIEALHLSSGVTAALGLGDVPAGSVTIRSSDPGVTVTGPDARHRISVTSNAAVTTQLTGHDSGGTQITPTLWLTFGTVVKHTGMEVDLVADLLSGSDPVLIHTTHRFLNNNDDTIFNENWQAIIDHRGPRACGTVAKDGGQALWRTNADEHHFRAYHIPLKVPRGRSSVKVNDRNQVKFKESTITAGRNAIGGWLRSKKKPVLVGVLYGPIIGRFLLTNVYGSIERTGLFGHTVMIVGCDTANENFLYIDPWHGGSQLTYEGGITAASKFQEKCSMGILQLDKTNSPPRGPALRQTVATEGTFGTADGTFLEVISGP